MSFLKIRQNGADRANFNTIFGYMNKGYTNLFSHNTTHNALYSRVIGEKPELSVGMTGRATITEELVLEMLKRTSGMKTLLTQNGFIEPIQSFKEFEDEETKAWFETRDEILKGANAGDKLASELAENKWDLLDTVLEEHLAPFIYINESNYMSIAMGVPVFGSTRRDPCTLGYLKFALTVILRYLYTSGVKTVEMKTPLTNLTDEEFVEFLKGVNNSEVIIPKDSKDLSEVVETMIVFGFFELAAKFECETTRKTAGFRRISTVPDSSRLPL
jgi:hypothetical protein